MTTKKIYFIKFCAYQRCYQITVVITHHSNLLRLLKYFIHFFRCTIENNVGFCWIFNLFQKWSGVFVFFCFHQRESKEREIQTKEKSYVNLIANKSFLLFASFFCPTQTNKIWEKCVTCNPRRRAAVEHLWETRRAHEPLAIPVVGWDRRLSRKLL